MVTNYEEIYKNDLHALGAPVDQLVKFFEQYILSPARVLDLGCGQGRDALFIARLGHRVVAIDNSPTGIDQLSRDAEKEGLEIVAEVADVISYQPVGKFHVVLFDRVLHMLDDQIRLEVLMRNLPAVREGGFVLIIDEVGNIEALGDCFERSELWWDIVVQKRGNLFAQRRVAQINPDR